ncbi:MAG: carboxylesterase [Caulobacter sp.]|nr:carboxylesterase [Caulobacter sp.]
MSQGLDRRRLLAAGAGMAALAGTRAWAVPPFIRGDTVQTTAGRVQGLMAGNMNVFLGLRYGAPPVGPLRFKPPQKPASWAGTADALHVGAPAVQLYTTPASNTELGKSLVPVFPTAQETLDGREDCLFLNVWTRATDKKKRPVMVWLHGGGFAYGSGGWPMYDGTNLANKGDVVVVTLNHRLNVFGYLAVGAPGYEDSGNAGMLDIVLALVWVRDNITAFGGDPGNVMIFGESGGGAKVSYLLAMPAAKGLFHKAVIESGPGVTAVPKDRADKLAADLYAELGIKPGDTQALMDLPADKLLAASIVAQNKQPGTGFERAGFAPVVDGRTLARQPWEPDAPAISADVPVMIGFNKDEMTLFLASAPWFGRLDEATLAGQASAILGPKGAATLAALKETFPDYSPSYLACALVTYGRMFMGSVRIAERKAAQKRAPVWFYTLSYETPVGGGVFKTPHTLEIPLVFGNVENSRALVGPGPDPLAVSAQMSDAWLAFAHRSDPNAPSLPDWRPYEASHRATMVFNVKSQVREDPYYAIRKALD